MNLMMNFMLYLSTIILVVVFIQNDPIFLKSVRNTRYLEQANLTARDPHLSFFLFGNVIFYFFSSNSNQQTTINHSYAQNKEKVVNKNFIWLVFFTLLCKIPLLPSWIFHWPISAKRPYFATLQNFWVANMPNQT